MISRLINDFNKTATTRHFLCLLSTTRLDKEEKFRNCYEETEKNVVINFPRLLCIKKEKK